MGTPAAETRSKHCSLGGREGTSVPVRAGDTQRARSKSIAGFFRSSMSVEQLKLFAGVRDASSCS
jgi:hypothetical protein